MNVIDFLTDPDGLGQWFAGPSWATWRAVLGAAYGLPLGEDGLARFNAVAGGRKPPERPVREIVAIAGRRGGKDSIASGIATYAATCVDYAARLRPGEMALVMCLATDRTQAAIVLKYLKGYFDELPQLRAMVESETADGLILSNGVEIAVATNSYRAVRGRTIACVIFDEAAFWRDERSATPDQATYDAVRPGMATLAPDSILIIISSPYRRSGLLYSKWKAHFGKNSDDVLVIQAPTLALNPTLDPQIVADAIAEDPAAAGPEWLAMWRDDISAFLSRDLIEGAVEAGRLVRPPVEGVRYVGFCDPSGGVGDAMTLGIAHAEGDHAMRHGVLDCIVERRPPFNPSEAVAEMASVLKSYGVHQIEGDRYAAQWVVESFRQSGITYKHCERDRSAIYLDAIPLFTSGRAALLDSKRLITQLVQLERKTSSSGKDRIDHPASGHDDLANAAAGALTLAASVPQPIAISEKFLAQVRAAGSYRSNRHFY